MRRARVSERTIRRDIAAGRLAVIRFNARVVRIRRRDAYYRMTRVAERGLTVQEFAEATALSVRTIRRAIAAGQLCVIRPSARSLYIVSVRPGAAHLYRARLYDDI